MSSRTGVSAFLIITFATSWAAMFAAPLLFGLSLINPLVQLSFAMSPAIAAIVVRAWITREGFADAGMALRIRRAPGLYIAAWLGPLGFIVVTMALAAALGLWSGDLGALDSLVPGLPGWATIVILMSLLPLLAPLYWGEEFGWTSYLRLRILTHRPILSTMVTGFIWAVWHYPLAFLGYIEFDNVIVGLAIWTFAFMGQEVILSWLRIRSGTIWTTSLAHAGNNMVLFMVTGALLGNNGVSEDVATLLVAVAVTPVAGWILWSGRLSASRVLERQPVSSGV